MLFLQLTLISSIRKMCLAIKNQHRSIEECQENIFDFALVNTETIFYSSL